MKKVCKIIAFITVKFRFKQRPANIFLFLNCPQENYDILNTSFTLKKD
jgi:hypothetical protein